LGTKPLVRCAHEDRDRARGAGCIQARFADDDATWIEGGPGRQLSNAAELDALTTSTCPTRSQVPKALGVQSFSAALG
jgi:hypothetical protein